MQTKYPALFPRTLLCVALLSLLCARANSQTATIQARIIQAVDEKNLVVLKGNVHPLARPEFDQGAVSDGELLHRMLLLLQRSSDQEAALQKLLDDQQNKSSPNYHAWLTPAQFGQQFGPAESDIQAVTSWLQLHGFQINSVAAGRTVIEFSGTAAQVRGSFHTEIHKYLVNGEARTANASDPQIPAALTPVVAGVVSLNNFPAKSHVLPLGSFFRSKSTGETRPLTTTGSCGASSCFALGPADFATIYNSAPLLNGTPKVDGTGQTIAIVGESNINVADVTDFRTIFNLPQNFSAANIILNGSDPGINGSEGESDLDVQWAGAVAPGATIDFVTSAPTETTAGIFLSATYIVDNNLAGVMSESFGACEQLIGTLNQFHNSLWEQAAAQGITVMVSSGDGGSAGCDNFDTAQTATHGLGVSGFASTPFNVAVGGTDFDDFNRWTQFWSTTNDPTTQGSALGYIPEIPWNDSCAQLGITGCGASAPQGSLNIVAGSGGASTLYAKPSWQSGTGVPLDNHRDVPDVSLFASNGFDASFYIICQRDASGTSSCNLNDLGFTFQGIGGTSASAPAFAGIMALVNQNQGTPQNPAPRQGNANYVLYQLFKKQTNTAPALNCNSSATPSSACTFYDVTRGNSALANSTTGTNSVPCAGSSPNCSIKTAGTNGVLVTAASPTIPAYSTTTGYDLATGLGSVNVVNLVNNWSSVTFLPSTTTLSATVNGQVVTSISGITHGTPVSVSSTVAAGQGATGTPSGQVALLGTPNPEAGSPGPSLGFDPLILTNGMGTDTNAVLPGGIYTLTAHYQGDGTFGASDSTPGISVNISAEPSKTLISIPVFDPTTGSETGNAPTSLVYGSPYIARIDVGNANATGGFPPPTRCTPPNCPTGTITWTDSVNGGTAVPLDGGSFALNSSGYTEDQPIQLSGGSHVLSASYSGDKSYGSSSATYSLTVTPAPTLAVFTNNPIPLVGMPLTMNVVGGPDLKNGVAPTGTVSMFDGSVMIGGPVAVTPDPPSTGFPSDFSAAVQITYSTGGDHQITAKYTGDVNYGASSSTPLAVHPLYPTTMTVTLSTTTINYGQSVTVTAVVTGSSKGPALTGQIQFFGTSTPINGPVTATAGTDANGNPTLAATVSTTPQSSEQVSVSYGNDQNYLGETSAGDFITVNIPDFSLPASTTVTVTAGQSQTVTINITPQSALPSTVTLSPSAQLPPGMTLSFNPSMVSLNGAPVSVTVTITTIGPAGGPVTSAMAIAESRVSPLASGLWLVSLLSGLVTLAVLAMPRMRKSYGAALFAATSFILTLALGCGGGSGAGSIGGGGGGGAVPTTTNLTTSSAKVPSGQPFTLTATITSTKTAAGTANIFAGHPPVGLGVAPPIQVVNGTVSAIVTNPPTFSGPGTYEFWAQYMGDANTLASQTTTSVQEVLTGVALASYTGQTGGLSHQGTIAITLQ